MHCERDPRDSDSDSLPDLNEILSPQPTTISPGDIVWAKFKRLYWPALVRAVYTSQKKISIWYCDDPGKTFKVPLKNICLFHDSEKYEKILKDVKEAGVLKEHEGLMSHANSYLSRKADGHEDDPRKFFDQTYPFYFAEEMLKRDPTADVSDIKIRPMYISHEKKQTLRQRISVRNYESEDSELESEDSDNDAKNCNINDYVSEIHQQLQESENNRTKEVDEVVIDKILEYILSGQADDYLWKIKSKKIVSEHRDLFEKSIKNRGKGANDLTFTGPINDNNKLLNLILYLSELYEKFDRGAKKRRISSKKFKARLPVSFFNEKTIDAQYVACVFFPESIIFALSKVKNISLTKAKNLFVGNYDYKTETMENLLKCVDPFFLDEHTSKQASESVDKNFLQNKEQRGALKHSADDDTSMCSQVKKICINKCDTSTDESKNLTTLKNPKGCEEVNLKETTFSKVDSSKTGYDNKILNFILSGKADDYLKKIKLNEVQSSYFKIYNQAVKCGKKTSCNITYTGPVKNDNDVKKLMLYLLPLYNEVSNSHKSKRSAAKRCKTAMAAYYVTQNSSAVLYVVYVWLPESIIFALSETENVALSEAKKLFDEYAEAKLVSDILKLLE